MDKLSHMRAFVAVCERGSFTAAAEVMGTYPSRVSQQVSALEDHLGVSLLSRNTRTVHVTDAGRQYLDFCRGKLTEISDFESQLKDGEADVTGLVRLSLAPFFAQSFMPDLLQEITSTYPGVRLDIRTDESVLDMIDNGIDLAIRAGEMPDSRLIARTFYRGKRGLYASAKYLESFGCPQAIEDLDQHWLIVFSGHQRQRHWSFEEAGVSGVFKPAPVIEAENVAMVLELLRRDIGIARLSDWVVQAADARSHIRPLKIKVK